MKTFTFAKLILLSVLLLGFTACEEDDQSQTEYWLPGTWKGTVGGSDATFMFNESRTGSYRIGRDEEGTFNWYFEDEQYWDAPSGTIVLDFGYGDKACITGTYADKKSISGWYFEFYEDYLDGYDGEALVLRRVGF